jgi:hypothetical protein
MSQGSTFLEKCSVKIPHIRGYVSLLTYCLFYYMRTYICVCVCVCVCVRARAPCTSTLSVVIGNVKFNTSNTNSPQTGYYLQAVTLTHLPLIAIDREQTDSIITHIGTLKVSGRQKLCTDTFYASLQASTAKLLRTVLFWVITQK